ncbi:hypothetical protein ACIGG9_27745 [Pseudonocardia alni]|uniref:hypothetical protein n=1 Tax=Pseudonocardia alni TaxID=33907 RepID=UPI0033D6A867
MTVVLTGAFGLFGVLGGALLTGILNARNDKVKRIAEESRQWTTDRRELYASFTKRTESMLREVDRVAVFLGYNPGDVISDEDEAIVSEGLTEYVMTWDDELQGLLEEVQLVGSERVVDLADRVSGALMAVTAPIELRRSFVEYHPQWFMAKDLLGVLRNAMRTELGLPVLAEVDPVRADKDWPWLPDRPGPDHWLRRQDQIQGKE